MDTNPHVAPTRFVTAEVPGVGGHLRERPEDFLVEEIPAYQPAGEGEHIYMFVEKRRLSTMELIAILSRHFRVPREAVGIAGLKDKHAITRQVVSIHTPGKTPEDFPMLDHPRVGVLWVDLHTNKLKRGHLKGNRFSIRIRGVDPTAVRHALRTMHLLEQRGAPDRVGEQRFGYRLNNHLVGRAIVLGAWDEAVREILRPIEVGSQGERQLEARRAWEAGDIAQALDLMPPSLSAERAVLASLNKGHSPERAARSVGRREIEFYLSALQSAAFNMVLDRRLDDASLGTLIEGDVAFKHDNGAVFTVDRAVLDDPATSQRLSSFAISPSGPMWGPGMKRAEGAVDQIERSALAELGLTPQALDEFQAREKGKGRWRLEGSRRPLRVPVGAPEIEGGVDEHGPFVRCAFDLPRGAFATVVMREVMKPSDELHDDGDQPPEEGDG